MEHFDDLLSSSPQPFAEANPFADPFVLPRAGSPDPWASFSSPAGFQSSARDPADNDTHIPESYITSSVSHFEVPHQAEPEPESTTEYVAPSNVSESTTIPASSIQEPTKSGSPSSVKDVSLETPVLKADTSPSVLEPEPYKAIAELIVEHAPGHAEWRTIHEEPQSTQTSSPAFVAPGDGWRSGGPLDDAPTPFVEQPFASLSIGGETAGGRKDSFPTFTTETEEPSPPGPSENKPTTKEGSGPSQTDAMFHITIEDPQKVGDPIRPYIMYTVHTKTISPLFAKEQFSVLRRYSDFVWLYDTLVNNNPGVIVPPLPEKSPFGRFENQFIQQRRMALEKCLQKIANHPVLVKDSDFKLFLDSDNFALSIKHRRNETGGLISTIGQTITGSRFFETDDWFDSKRAYLDNLETQLRSLVKNIDFMSKQRAELAVSMGEFSTAIAELSASDLSKPLSHALQVLSDVEKQAQDLQNIQAQEDFTTLLSTVDEYTRLIGSIRASFQSRIRCYGLWQTAESDARRVKQSYEKTRSQGRAGPAGYSLNQVVEAERKVMEAKQLFERSSNLIKSEMIRFEEERVQDMKRSIETFLEGMAARQKEIISSWEKYQELLIKKVNVSQRPAGGPQATVS